MNRRPYDEDPELEYARSICKKKLACGKSLLELSTYDGVSMWWFKDNSFYFTVKKARDSRASGNPNPHRLLLRIYPYGGLYAELLYDFALSTLTKAMAAFGKKKSSTEKPKAVFASRDNEWRSGREAGTYRLKKIDAIFDSVIKKAGDRYDFLGVCMIDTNPMRGLRIYAEKLLSWETAYRPMSCYWTPATWRKQKDAYRIFAKAWESLREDAVLREICFRGGCDIHKEVMATLESYFLLSFPKAVKYVHEGRNMIEKEKPSIVLVQNEDGPERYYLVAASKLASTPVLALQHGTITPTHWGYMHAEDEISATGSVQSPYCPIPDKMAVYGTYHKELLTQVSAYPKECVEVTGQPRYDLLSHAEEIYSKKRFMEEHDIPPKNKIVLWLPLCHWMSDEENADNFAAIFGAVEELGEITLFIKQHPGESDRCAQMIRESLKKYRISAFLMPKGSDTFEQLYACDLVITKDSTAAMEAVALNKPVIVLNLGGKPDAVDYVEQGIAEGVYAKEKMKAAVSGLLSDDSKQAEKRRAYIEKYMYKIDGKATERVIELMDEMASKKDS